MRAHVTAVLEVVGYRRYCRRSQDVVVRCKPLRRTPLGVSQNELGAAGRLRCWQRLKDHEEYPAGASIRRDDCAGRKQT